MKCIENIFYFLFTVESDQKKHVQFFVRVSLKLSELCFYHFVKLEYVTRSPVNRQALTDNRHFKKETEIVVLFLQHI